MTRRLRVGLMDPVMVARPRVDAVSRANYLGAVANRVDSYWVPDHINGQTPKPLWDPRCTTAARMLRSPAAAMEAWTLLGSLATRRRFPNMRLGIGVTDTGKRHPAVTAQAAATLNLLTKGRAILGIGPGERVGNEPYGVDWSKPVARFEEALATIRALWDSKGQLVKRDSLFYPLRDAMFDLAAYRGKWPEIWVAAHGPRMLRATGRYGDAWFPGFAHRPQDYAQRLEIVRSAASDAGRVLCSPRRRASDGCRLFRHAGPRGVHDGRGDRHRESRPGAARGCHRHDPQRHSQRRVGTGRDGARSWRPASGRGEFRSDGTLGAYGSCYVDAVQHRGAAT